VHEEVLSRVEEAAVREREREQAERRRRNEALARRELERQKKQRELQWICAQVGRQKVWGLRIAQQDGARVAYAFRHDVPPRAPLPEATEAGASPGAEAIPQRSLDALELERHLIQLIETGEVSRVVWDRRAQAKVRRECGVGFTEWWNSVTKRSWHSTTMLRRPERPVPAGERPRLRPTRAPVAPRFAVACACWIKRSRSEVRRSFSPSRT
jgi:hypothetical protein